MNNYTIEDIRAWLKAYGAPEWLQGHLTKENLDKVAAIAAEAEWAKDYNTKQLKRSQL